jgi:hypothetical protein
VITEEAGAEFDISQWIMPKYCDKRRHNVALCPADDGRRRNPRDAVGVSRQQAEG